MSGGPRHATPITIRGVTYPSHAAAAKALGVSVPRISQAKAEGALDRIGKKVKGNPITVDGVTYPSHAAYARSYGGTGEYVSYLVRKGVLKSEE